MQAGAIAEEYKVFFVSCTFCGSRGPAGPKPEDAVNVWNDDGAAMRKTLEAAAEKLEKAAAKKSEKAV